MKLIKFSLLILVLTLFSCSVSLVPTKSAYAQATLLTITTEVSSVFDRATTISYPVLAPDYSTVLADIDSLTSYDQLRANSAKLVTQDKNIRNFFDTYRQKNQVEGILTVPEVQVFRSFMKSIIKPRLISENQTN